MILIPDLAFPGDHALEREAASGETLLVRRAERPDDIADAEWRAADAIVAYHRLVYDAALCARLERCRILVRAGVGTDTVDLAAFARRGIPVCNVPDYGTEEVADHTIALLLALARGIVSFHNNVAADPVAGWDWRRAVVPVRRLRGRTLLLIGYGAIGRAVAHRAAALALEVAVYDPYAAAGNDGAVTRCDDLDAALGAADFVSLHATLSPATHGLIDRGRVAAMKRGAILINTARGALVELDAVADGLASGQLGAAALDVLPDEPPDPGHPLLRRLGDGRLILTPHVAFLSAEAIRDMRVKAVATALAFLRDGSLVNCVNLRGGAV